MVFVLRFTEMKKVWVFREIMAAKKV